MSEPFFFPYPWRERGLICLLAPSIRRLAVLTRQTRDLGDRSTNPRAVAGFPPLRSLSSANLSARKLRSRRSPKYLPAPEIAPREAATTAEADR